MRWMALLAVLFSLLASEASAQEMYATDLMPPKEAIPAGFVYLPSESWLCCQGMAMERSYGKTSNRWKVSAVVLPTAEDAVARCQEIVAGRPGEITEEAGYGERAWRTIRQTPLIRFESLYFQQGGVCAGVSQEADSRLDPAEQAANLEMLVRLVESKALGR